MFKHTWIMHDLAIPRRGSHAIGAARQAATPDRRPQNCQVVVVLSRLEGTHLLPVSCRLFLPKEWASDPVRRRTCGIPAGVGHLARPDIALDLLAAAGSAGNGPGVVAADASFGHCTAFRATLTSRGFAYAVEIRGGTLLRPGGTQVETGSSEVKPAGTLVRAAGASGNASALPAEQVAVLLGAASCQDLADSRFLACRVRTAFPGDGPATIRPEQWLVAEWPMAEPRPVRFWLSTLEPGSSMADLAQLASAADRAADLGRDLLVRGDLAAYDGCDWAGFHGHAVRCLTERAKAARSVTGAAAT